MGVAARVVIWTVLALFGILTEDVIAEMFVGKARIHYPLGFGLVRW